MPVTSNTLACFPNNTLVETGTYFGGGIIAALGAGFPRVCSIEMAPDLHARARAQFAGEPHVELYEGSSAVRLGEILETLTQPATFWLDAHYAGGNTAGAYDCPLLRELQLLAAHPIKTHTILVDDVHVFSLDLPSMEQILAGLRAVNPEYDYFMLESAEPHLGHDILLAQPGRSTGLPVAALPLLTTGPFSAPGAWISVPNTLGVCGVPAHTVHGRHHHCARCDGPSSYRGHWSPDGWRCFR